MTMDAAEFLAEHAARRRDALSAAAACLLQGQPQAARDLLRQHLRLEDADTARLLDHLCGHLPRPAPVPYAALLADPATLPALAGEPAPDWIWRERLEARLQRMPLPAPPDERTRVERLAWGLLELASVGAEVERRQRAPWGRVRYPSEAALEATTAALWAGWFSGNPWSIWADWERLFLPDATRAFAAVLRVRRIPPERRTILLDDLRESFLFMLIGDGQGTPGWRELAVRVLETAAPDPLAALCQHLDTRGWLAASACAVRRGHGPRSAAVLFPATPHPAHQARQLARRGEGQPSALDSALELHVACRLIERWSRDPETTCRDRSWQVVLQNRGRARARLRALLAGGAPERLLAPLLSLEGLCPRTRRAVRSYARDWAWIQLSRQFPFHVHRLDPPCHAPDEDEPLFSASDADLLRTWVLLVVLKGRLDHLEQWIQTGGTGGDRDATWGRLLLDLPDRLRDFDPDGRASRGQHRLRAELADQLPELLEALRPLLMRLSLLPAGRDYGALVNALLDEASTAWSPAIPRPLVRRQYHSHIAAALDRLQDDAPDSPPGGA